MATRNWTLEELDRTHPLPEGWEWAYDQDVNDGLWHAWHEVKDIFVFPYATTDSDFDIEIFPGGRVPRAVIEVVILASEA